MKESTLGTPVPRKTPQKLPYHPKNSPLGLLSPLDLSPPTYYLLHTMTTQGLSRTSLHLDRADMQRLTSLAEAETLLTGIRVTAAGIVRRIIKAYLRQMEGEQ